MKNFFLLLVCWMHGVVVGQEKYQKIKTIEWDYLTGSYRNDSIYKHLKVNDVVQIKLTNLPEKYKMTSSVTFQNNHLESRNDFSNLIQFDKNTPFLETNKTKSIVGNAKEEIKKDSIQRNNKISNEKVINSLKDKKKKVNNENLYEALEINDAKKIIEESKDKLSIKDINWQRQLIEYAQKNWTSDLKIRDSIIDVYEKDIDKFEKKIKAQSIKIEEFERRKNFSFPPIKIENYDYTTFTFEIIDEISKNSTNLNIPLKNYNGFKVDFSTGILVNGLFSPSYKIIENSTENTKRIVEEANPSSKFNTGICLLAHAYPRLGEFANFGIGSGFSYNLNQQNLNFLLGGSFLWGAEQRFITTLGVNIGKVKELSSYYEINTDYSSSEFTPNTDVPTVDVLKASWFVSITYNLGLNNSTKNIKL